MYAARYISDRFLPDKAIDLVDEAASSLRLAQESKPDELEALDREIMTLQIELESLKKESDTFSVERREKVEADLAAKRTEASQLTTIWQTGQYSFQDQLEHLVVGQKVDLVKHRTFTIGAHQRRQAAP